MVEGLVQLFKIKEESFNPELLRFEFKSVTRSNVIILNKVFYNDKTLKSVKDNCKVIGQEVYFK
jgi:signal peptidase I